MGTLLIMKDMPIEIIPQNVDSLCHSLLFSFILPLTNAKGNG